jgi:hypothetical protein
MRFLQLLEKLDSLGVVVTVVDSNLRCCAPRGVLDDNLKSEILVQKENLMRLLVESDGARAKHETSDRGGKNNG